ncbi:MAG: hypothetical protein QXK01_08965 [Thermofilum sp.]|uniref:hypothetical protein n=1 Tax=Thermofilum sp. TaxID=1961369 RepID=UPI003164DA6D
MRLVYWMQNGEVKKKEVDFGEIVNAEVLATWIGPERYQYGRWKYLLCKLGEKYYLVREWRPAPGLSWDEVEVYEVGVE